jgi:hypothetical protein
MGIGGGVQRIEAKRLSGRLNPTSSNLTPAKFTEPDRQQANAYIHDPAMEPDKPDTVCQMR